MLLQILGAIHLRGFAIYLFEIQQKCNTPHVIHVSGMEALQ